MACAWRIQCDETFCVKPARLAALVTIVVTNVRFIGLPCSVTNTGVSGPAFCGRMDYGWNVIEP